MKTAKLVVVTVTVGCPYCEEDQVDPVYGSYHWEVNTISQGQVITCDDCGEEFRLPKRVIGKIN
jgi:hypothetical protein